MKVETKGILFGLIGVSAFGLTLPATRVVIAYLDPIFIGLGRAVVAALIAGILLLYNREKLPAKKQLFELTIVALGVVIGFPVLSSWAMQYVPASHGGVVLGVLPLATAIAGAVIGHDRPSVKFWCVSALGSLLVVLYALIQGAGGFHIADLALWGAVLCAAIGYAVGARLSSSIGGWQVICWALILAFPLIIIPAIYYAPSTFNIPLSGLLSFIYLSLVSQLFAFFFWYKGLSLGGIARVSQTQLLQPFVTLFASALLLGELIDIETIIFVFLVVGIVWLGKRMPIAQKRA